MAIPVIYQGDDTNFNGTTPLSVSLSTDFDLDGHTVTLWFCGCRRDFTGLTGRAATLPLSFSAKETGGFPIGTHNAQIAVFDATGRKRTASDSVRIRVTDDLREAYGAEGEQDVDVEIEMGVDPARLMEGQTLRTNTPNGMRQAIKKIAQALGATVSVLAVAALPVFGASVQTAPLGELDLDQNPSVVTNVDLSGLLTAHQDISGKADRTNTYTKAETDAKIVELSPPTSLGPATNYTDAALGAFAATGAVARALSYGTPTRWTDATGCVWEVGQVIGPWSFSGSGIEVGATYSVEIAGESSTFTYLLLKNDSLLATTSGEDDVPMSIRFAGTDYGAPEPMAFDIVASRSYQSASTLVGRVALTNDIPDVSGYTTQQQATNAATAVADTKISTNNAAFVSAVLAVPIAGADASDSAELAEYGSYGTVGAALLALIAGLAALKRGKASMSDLPYALVTAEQTGDWQFSDGGSHTISVIYADNADPSTPWAIAVDDSSDVVIAYYATQEAAQSTLDAMANCSFYPPGGGDQITATRAYALQDRSGNTVAMASSATLQLPPPVAGKARDFLVRLEIADGVTPNISFADPTGETLTYETDGDEFPVPDEAGDWLYSFTETKAGVFAVALKSVTTVAQGGA